MTEGASDKAVAIETGIADLEATAKSEPREMAVFDALSIGLEQHRHGYRSDKTHYPWAVIERLRKLKYYRDLAEQLMHLREGLMHGQSPTQWKATLPLLLELQAALGNLAMCGSVEKELKEATKALGGDSTFGPIRRQASKRAHRRGMEALVEPCPNGHLLKLRHSTHGFFWGCATYPRCRYSRELTEEELEKAQ